MPWILFRRSPCGVWACCYESADTEQRKKDRKYIKGMGTITCCNNWSWNCSLVSSTKCSLMAAIINYGAWRCFLTHKIHVRQPSFHFVQQTEQFSACQKLCSSDAPQFWWLFLEKKVRIIYTGKYGSKPLDTLCCWFMLVFFNLLLGLLQD